MPCEGDVTCLLQPSDSVLGLTTGDAKEGSALEVWESEPQGDVLLERVTSKPQPPGLA